MRKPNRLLAADANALLIGFVLDQQVPVQKAFAGPKVLLERLGHLDPARIAAMDEAAFIAVCVERPAIHRFPANMARRVQELCRVIATDYDGDGSRVWTEAADGADLYARLGSLPGFGDMKINSLAMLLHRRYGVDLPGLDALLPTHPVLGGVDDGRGARRLPGAQAGDEGRRPRGGRASRLIDSIEAPESRRAAESPSAQSGFGRAAITWPPPTARCDADLVGPTVRRSPSASGACVAYLPRRMDGFALRSGAARFHRAFVRTSR